MGDRSNIFLAGGSAEVSEWFHGFVARPHSVFVYDSTCWTKFGLKTVISQNLIRHHEIPFRSYRSMN